MYTIPLKWYSYSMVNISKRKLSKEMQKELYTQLADIFLSSDSRKESERTLTEILTKTEKVMLAKRVGIIAMLERGYSSYKIMNTLNVSTLTIARVQKRLSCGIYQQTVEVLKRRKSRESIFGLIEEAVMKLSPARANQTLQKQMARDISKIRAGSR